MLKNPIASVIADCVRPRWLPELNLIAKPAVSSIEEYLLTGSYTWSPSSTGSAHLEIGSDTVRLSDAFANEIARFSCAAYESLIDISLPIPNTRSIGWQLIQQYYSAFYSAHALLRISGISLTYIPSKTCTTLNKIGASYLGVSPQLSSGVHFIEYKSHPTKHLIINKLKIDAGSHEEMWFVLTKYLLDVENAIVTKFGADKNALEAVDIIQTVRKKLTQNGHSNGGWASSVRSAVNYKHEYGVWFPKPNKSSHYINVKNNFDKWKPNHPDFLYTLSKNDDLSSYAYISNLLNHMLTSILSDISMRSPKPRYSFVDRLPFKLLRLHGLI